MTQPRRVAIVGGNRIPFARSNTVYATASNQEMLISALDGLVERFNLHGERLGEVVAGAVLKHSRDFNLTRECVLGSRLAPETPAYDLQQACGTGLEAALLVANKIALGQIECGIAGGVDTTSDAPIGVNEGLRSAASPAVSTPLRMRRSASMRGCARFCCRPTVARAPATRSKACCKFAHAICLRRCRVMVSRAPGCRWVSIAN